MTICNTRVAYNGKFFVIGLVSDTQSKIGVFAFQKENFNSRPLLWVSKFLFSTFYMDDHLT